MNSLFGRVLRLFVMLVAVAHVPAAAASTAPVPGKAALVNGATISTEEYAAELRRVERLRARDGASPDADGRAELGRKVLDNLIDRELLYQESRRHGIKASESAIAEKEAELKRKFATENDYVTTLREIGTSPAAVKVQIEKGMTVRKFIDSEFAENKKVAPAEIASYYESHRDELRLPPRVRISHILVKSDPSWSAGEKDAARARIEAVRQRALKGEQFSLLARTISECPSSRKGGDLGFVKPGELSAAMEDAVFALKPGEMSGVVEDIFGFHLVKVTEKFPGHVPPLDSVEGKIRLTLKRQKARKEMEAFVKKLRDGARVEIRMEEGDF